MWQQSVRFVTNLRLTTQHNNVEHTDSVVHGTHYAVILSSSLAETKRVAARPPCRGLPDTGANLPRPARQGTEKGGDVSHAQIFAPAATHQRREWKTAEAARAVGLRRWLRKLRRYGVAAELSYARSSSLHWQ